MWACTYFEINSIIIVSLIIARINEETLWGFLDELFHGSIKTLEAWFSDKYGVSATFNVPNVSSFDVDDKFDKCQANPSSR